MSLQKTFNGVRLVKPGAASRVISKLQNKGIPGSGTLAVIGTARRGPIGLTRFTDPDKMRAVYRSGDLADAAGIPWNASNDEAIQGKPAEVLAFRVAGSGVARSTSSALVNGSDANLIVLTSRDYGADANKIAAEFANNILKLSITDGLDSFSEASPALAGLKFSIQYTGAGTNPTFTNSGAQFATTVTGDAAAAITLDLTVYTTIADIMAALTVTGKYTVALASGANPSFPSSQLDRSTAVAIGTETPTTVTGQVQDVIDWVNQNSSLATAAREAAGTVAGKLKATIAKAYFTSGNDGTTPVQSDWDAAFTAMKAYRVHALVPLYSTGGLMASITAASQAYSTQMNGTGGKNEVQVYIGEDANKTNLLLNATTILNDFNVCYCFQKHTLPGADGVMKVFPAWSSALIAASMRVSAPLGEPLTFKYVRSYGLTQDATFDLVSDMDQLLLSGVLVFEVAPGKGTRIVKGNTSYTKKDDDGYTEESVVFAWKQLSYGLRSYLEDIYCGKRGTPASVSAIADDVGAYCEKFRQAEVLVDSMDDAGKPLHAWRDVKVNIEGTSAEVGLECTFAEGINFILPTIYLTPVRLSA